MAAAKTYIQLVSLALVQRNCVWFFSSAISKIEVLENAKICVNHRSSKANDENCQLSIFVNSNLVPLIRSSFIYFNSPIVCHISIASVNSSKRWKRATDHKCLNKNEHKRDLFRLLFLLLLFLFNLKRNNNDYTGVWLIIKNADQRVWSSDVAISLRSLNITLIFGCC